VLELSKDLGEVAVGHCGRRGESRMPRYCFAQGWFLRFLVGDDALNEAVLWYGSLGSWC
jgi:hypothetical protein